MDEASLDSRSTSTVGGAEAEGVAPTLEIALSNEQLNALVAYKERLKRDSDKLHRTASADLETLAGESALSVALREIGNITGPIHAIEQDISKPGGKAGIYDPESHLSQEKLNSMKRDHDLLGLYDFPRRGLGELFRAIQEQGSAQEPEGLHPKYVSGVPVVFSRQAPVPSTT